MHSRDPATCPSLWLGPLPPPTSPLVLPAPGTFCNKEAPPPLPPPATQAAVLGLPHPTPPLPLERQLQLWDTGWGEGIEGLDSPRQQGAESLSCKMPIEPIIPRPAQNLLFPRRRLQATTYSPIAHLLSAYYASGGFQPSPEGRQPRSGHSAGYQRRVVWPNPRRGALHPAPSRQVDLRAAQTAAQPGRSAVAPALRAKSKAEMRRWTEEGGERKQRGREGNGRWPPLPKGFQKKRCGDGVWEAASATALGTAPAQLGRGRREGRPARGDLDGRGPCPRLRAPPAPCARPFASAERASTGRRRSGAPGPH